VLQLAFLAEYTLGNHSDSHVFVQAMSTALFGNVAHFFDDAAHGVRLLDVYFWFGASCAGAAIALFVVRFLHEADRYGVHKHADGDPVKARHFYFHSFLGA